MFISKLINKMNDDIFGSHSLKGLIFFLIDSNGLIDSNDYRKILLSFSCKLIPDLL